MTKYNVRARSIDGTVWAMQSPQMWSSERKDAFAFDNNDAAQARVMNQRQINDQVEPDAKIGQLDIVPAIESKTFSINEPDMVTYTCVCRFGMDDFSPSEFEEGFYVVTLPANADKIDLEVELQHLISDDWFDEEAQEAGDERCPPEAIQVEVIALFKGVCEEVTL